MAAAGAILRRHSPDSGIQWLPVKPWTCSIGRCAPRRTAASPWKSNCQRFAFIFVVTDFIVAHNSS